MQSQYKPCNINIYCSLRPTILTWYPCSVSRIKAYNKLTLLIFIRSKALLSIKVAVVWRSSQPISVLNLMLFQRCPFSFRLIKKCKWTFLCNISGVYNHHIDSWDCFFVGEFTDLPHKCSVPINWCKTFSFLEKVELELMTLFIYLSKQSDLLGQFERSFTYSMIL